MIRTLLCAVLLASVATLQAVAETPLGNPSSPTKALATKVSKFAISAPLSQAMDRYAKLAGLRIVTDWDALAAAGVKRETKVVLRASSATVEQLLDLTLAQVSARSKPLAWYLDGHVVRVTTQMRVLYRHALPSGAPATSRPAKRPAKRSATMQLRLDNVPLSDVIEYFRTVTGANFHVNWRSLELADIDRKTPITLNASGLSLARALDLVTDQLSAHRSRLDRVYWVVESGVVNIATGAALDRNLRTRVYDVADLLVVVPDFAAPRLDLTASEDGTDDDGRQAGFGRLFEDDEDDAKDADSVAQRRKRLRENLLAAIKDSVGEDMWQPVGKGAIRLMGNKLIISQTTLGFKLLERSAGKRR